MPPASSRPVNVSTIDATPISNELPLTATSTNSFLYHDGRIHLTSGNYFYRKNKMNSQYCSDRKNK